MSASRPLFFALALSAAGMLGVNPPHATGSDTSPDGTQQGTIYIDNADSSQCIQAPCPQSFETWFEGDQLYGSFESTSGGYRGTTLDAMGIDPMGIVPALPFGARWHLPANFAAGEYRVEVNIPSVSIRGVTLVSSASYSIRHAGALDSASISQRTERGWVDIGTYFFESIADTLSNQAVAANYIEIDVQESFNTDINSTLIDAVRLVPVGDDNTPITVQNYLDGYSDGAEIPVGSQYRTCYSVSAPTFYRWYWHDENVGHWVYTDEGYASGNHCEPYRTAENPGLRKMRIHALTSLEEGATVRASHEFSFRIVDSAPPACSDAFTFKIPPPYPTNVTAGESFEMAFSVDNSGSCAWTADEGYGLVAAENGMGADRVPVPQRVEPGSTVQFRFPMQAPSTPGEYVSRWRLVQDDAPFGPAIEATIRVAARVPTGQITGRVVDERKRALSELDVVLLDGDKKMLQRFAGGADDDGSFAFTALPPGTYFVRANLQTSDNRMRMCWGAKGFSRGDPQSEAACTIALTSKPIVVAHGPASLDLRMITTEGTVTGPAMAAGVFDKLASVYYTIRSFDQFVQDETTVDYGPVAFILAGWTRTGGQRYSTEGKFIALGEDVVIGEGKWGTNDQRDGEISIAHEAAHHFMNATIKIPQSDGGNHLGYCNPSSADSLVEGWAAFFAAAWYRTVVVKGGAYYSDMLHGMDENVNAREDTRIPGFCMYHVHQREDMALGTLLWDLYDAPGDGGRDGIDLTLAGLYSAMARTGHIDNVHHLFSILQTMESDGVRNENGSAVTTADLRDLFILHGFFEDGNGNREHDQGEVPGYSGEPSRRNRRFPTRSPRHSVRVTLSGVAPSQETRVRVIADHDELGVQEFETVLEADGLLYLPRPGEADHARMSLSVLLPGGWSIPYDLTGTAYVAAIESARPDSRYALWITFHPGRPPTRIWLSYLPMAVRASSVGVVAPGEPADIVFIVDTSAPMRTAFGSDASMLEATVDALPVAFRQLGTDGIGDRAAVVGYTLQPALIQSFTRDTTLLAAAAERLLLEPATASQIEPAFYEAIRLLDGARPGVERVVILVSTVSPGLDVGESDLDAADTLKRFGVRLIVVGLGTPGSTAWHGLASGPEEAITIDVPEALASGLTNAVLAAQHPR